LQFKAQIIYGDHVRIVELDRRAPSANALRNAVRSKYKLNTDPTLAFQQSNGQKIAIKTDEDLKKAMLDSANQNYLHLEIHGGAPPSAAARQAQAQPKAQAPPQKAAAPAHHGGGHQPAQTASAPRAAPAQQPSSPRGGSGNPLSFTVRGTGSAEKVKIQAHQEQDLNRFRFEPTPSREDATIEIELPSARQLTFKISTQKARLTQTFNMPFDVDLGDLQIQGNNVILPFPNF